MKKFAILCSFVAALCLLASSADASPLMMARSYKYKRTTTFAMNWVPIWTRGTVARYWYSLVVIKPNKERLTYSLTEQDAFTCVVGQYGHKICSRYFTFHPDAKVIGTLYIKYGGRKWSHSINGTVRDFSKPKAVVAAQRTKKRTVFYWLARGSEYGTLKCWWNISWQTKHGERRSRILGSQDASTKTLSRYGFGFRKISVRISTRARHVQARVYARVDQGRKTSQLFSNGGN